MNILATVLAFCILIIATTCTSSAFINDRSKYDIILNSHPFGAPPPPKAAGSGTPAPVVKKETPLAQSFARNLRLVGIRKSSRGTRVGFIDIKNKAGTSYLLYVGQGRDGITVVDANYDEEKALLEKEGEQHWIYMDGKTGIAGSTAAPASSKSSSRTSKSTARSSAPASSHRARLKSRLETVRKRTVVPPVLEGEALTKQLQEKQMEFIRKGQPPLPMRLTREMDDKLVKEGVLPPQQ